ncbi:uncharacterized protein LOC143578347 isoform X2 [Bidens hawaiensis]|uniref:uncharacterized protein LOC143578347 isoform X2 n=1 Tax=Bidens hawaiensis TaxID=980011 RepID=UPI00404A38C0
MLTGDNTLNEGNYKNLTLADHRNDETSSGKRRSRAYVWTYFEKITGEEGLPKTRCTTCNKVYSTAPNSGTSTMRRHLRKCCPPQPLTQFNPADTDEFRSAKKLKSVMVDNLQSKTDRDLVEFIWMNKRNVGILEQKFPEKARAIKEVIKCYEDEIDRRGKQQSPKEVSDQSVHTNKNFHDSIAEEERVKGLQIVAINRDYQQGEETQTAISTLPEDRCADLREVSSVLSMLTSSNSYYTPQNSPLDQEAENAKQTLIQLLNKNFESIVNSPNVQKVKSCIQVLTHNLHKLPSYQGRVIEALNTEFESTCQIWKTYYNNIQTNIALEVQQGDNLKVLEEWQEKDMEFESKITKVDADILRLKDELREKEDLVKQKLGLFDESKISIDEAKKILQNMVTAKLQRDVALDNMKEAAEKWERNRKNFQRK